MTGKNSSSLLSRLVVKLPHPAAPLEGCRAGTLSLPENIACFQRSSTRELNQPRRGRALHHRCVLIVPIRGEVPLCVDDREILLGPPQGLLVLPFQFHHYLPGTDKPLEWLFITFECVDTEPYETLRNQPFTVTAELRALLVEILGAYQNPASWDLAALQLGVVLARLRSARRPRPARPVAGAQNFATRVNRLVSGGGAGMGVKELAQELGISPAHLRARFQASCGVSLGRHLRRLRLERACGLLQMSNSRVADVAEKCGFNSIYSFSRAFRSVYGVSPMQYRKTGTRGTGKGIDAIG